jgi:glycosyltransferase involved in cell wall biosynthesis
MAMAKAIVASDLDQLGIVLKGGLRPEDFGRAGQRTGDGSAAGVLVEPGREEDLAAAIRFVVEHPEWRARLGATARRRILESYTWEHHVAAILEGFARVVKAGSD